MIQRANFKLKLSGNLDSKAPTKQSEDPSLSSSSSSNLSFHCLFIYPRLESENLRPLRDSLGLAESLEQPDLELESISVAEVKGEAIS